MAPTPQHAEVSTPWWRVGMVWLTLSGPAVVVVAAVVTAVIAFRGADPEVDKSALPALKSATQGADPLTPAVWAHNHAATATPPAPRKAEVGAP